MRFKVQIHYDAYGEMEVEADNEEEAVNIAVENPECCFEGEYTVDYVKAIA